jgi:cation-transporting P-type ATPase 13A2
VAGRVRVMVFDKTGTLTEDGLDVVGVCPITPTCVHLAVCQPDTRTLSRAWWAREVGALESAVPSGGDPPLDAVLAAAQALHRVGTELVGDPLDVRLLAYSGWVRVHPSPTSPYTCVRVCG